MQCREVKRFSLRWRHLSIGKSQADWGGQDPGVRYLQLVNNQWKGDCFAMNKREEYSFFFFFFLWGRGKRSGEQRKEWQGWKELGRVINSVKAMDASQRWTPWHLAFSGKSLVFLHLWCVILLSSSCSKISMKIYELWNISCFMWEEVCESQKEEYIWRRRICRNPGKDSLNFHRLWFWGLPRVGPVWHQGCTNIAVALTSWW